MELKKICKACQRYIKKVSIKLGVKNKSTNHDYYTLRPCV